MHRLVVIDDNPTLTAGITQLVDWTSYGITVAGKGNGVRCRLRCCSSASKVTARSSSC